MVAGVGEDDMEAAACGDLRIELANLGSGVPYSSPMFEVVGVDTYRRCSMGCAMNIGILIVFDNFVLD